VHKYARIERERRYLLDGLPAGVNPDDCQLIEDAYIEGARLRLRRMAAPDGVVTALKLTQKYRDAAQPAGETTITNLYLTGAEYERLKILGGLVLIKRRYPFLHDGARYSIDVFQGALEGLVLAEIEFQDGELPAEMPPFAVRDVTADPFFEGGALAALSRDEFERYMQEVNIGA
jgi:CYTH domain-containing protein